MTVFSYNRLEQIASALCEVVYAYPYALRRSLENRMPYIGRLTLDHINETNLGPEWQAVIKRLVKEDAVLARDGVDKVTLFAANLQAETWQEAIASFTMVPSDPEIHSRARQDLDARAIMVPNVPAVQLMLQERYPHLEFTSFSNARESRDDLAPSRNVYDNFEWRIKRDWLPADQQRYFESMAFSDWSFHEYMNYGTTDAARYAARFTGVAGNGRLVSANPSGPVCALTTYAFPTEADVLTNLERARQTYRQGVLSRLRGWRNPEEVRAAEHQNREARQAEAAVRFEKFRNKQIVNRDEVVIPTLPFVEAGKGIKASRRWGIEIETGAGRDLRGVPDQWDSKGDGSLESAYSGSERYIEPEDCDYSAYHDIETQTTVGYRESYETGEEREVEFISSDYINPMNCGSCGFQEVDDWDDDDCVELVSPILNSMHSRGLRQICEDLESAPRTDSAGVHVHVEVADMNVKQLKELVMAYDHIERFIESSYDRIERGYCKRRSARELLEVVRQPDDVDPRNMRTGDRYVTVNLQALSAHGTVEFRAMGPIYNYDHLIRWAMFCREMVNSIKGGAQSKEFARAKSWNDVTAIFAKYGVEYNIAATGEMDDSFAEDFELTAV